MLPGFILPIPAPIPETTWALNTSNRGKLEEYQQLFRQFGLLLSATQIDLPEIAADPITVVVHKASQLGEGVLIDDTSLDIEGTDVGIQVRWLKDQLPQLIGKKAHWIVLLAYRKGDLVYVYEGRVDGTIAAPQGHGGFGFDPYFIPDGASKTLAQEKPNELNARALAAKALINGEPIAVLPMIASWTGAWQPHD